MKRDAVVRWLIRNPGWRLLSLLLAALLWMNVATEPEMSTLMSVPIQFRDPPDTLEVIARAQENVQLEVRGSSGQLRDLSNSRPVVTLDFSQVREPGERTFTISRAETNLPRNMELVRAIPSQVRVQFERSEHRSVPVKAQFHGTPSNGLRLQSFHVEPEMEQIAGPASHDRRANEVFTDSIDLSLVDPGNPVAESTAYLSDSRLRFVSSPKVTVTMVLK